MTKITAPLREFDEVMGIRVYEVRLEDEPALWFQRDAFGKSMAYALPLSSAYQVADDRTLMERAFIMARELNLLKNNDEVVTALLDRRADQETVHRLMDLLTKHIDDLVQKIPPAPIQTRLEVENQLERSGIRSFRIDGEEMLH